MHPTEKMLALLLAGAWMTLAFIALAKPARPGPAPSPIGLYDGGHGDGEPVYRVQVFAVEGGIEAHWRTPDGELHYLGSWTRADGGWVETYTAGAITRGCAPWRWHFEGAKLCDENAAGWWLRRANR